MLRHTLTCLTLILPAAQALAQAPEASGKTSDVYACVELSEDAARLACYDAAVGRLKVAEESGELVTVTRADVEQVKKESFGFSMPTLPKLVMPKFGSDDAADIEEMVLEVERVSFGDNSGGGLTIYMKNGQVWQQVDDVSVLYSRKLEITEATIKTAALGSYKMTLNKGKSFRARRIQ